MKKFLIISIVLVLVGAGIIVYWRYFYQKAEEPQATETAPAKALELDPQKEATYLSKVGDTKGVYWVRGFDIIWQEIESEKGEIDWSFTDERLKEFNEMEIYPLVIVKPFANWDQNACHPEAKYEAEGGGMMGEKLKVGKPCDMTAYADFLAKAVERYDGDGQDDMPDLTIPIKYWEIMNEPSMQGGSTGGMGEELKFFVGTSQDYLDILKTSYQTIKRADSEAKVAHAGMAGMQQDFRDFWDPVFANGGGDYIDIANIHTIGTDDKREDLYMVKFLDYLTKYSLEIKPVWITEVQYGKLAEKPTNLKGLETLMVKSTAFSLALGADKLFYIDNWTFWDQELLAQKKEDKQESKEKDKEEKKEKPTMSEDVLNSSTHKVYLNLVDKVNNFDKVEIIKQDYLENPSESDGATCKIGQYKFVFGSKSVYVLWGEADLPAEISGKVKVTDIYGESTETETSEINLSNQPIFVESL